MVNVERQAYPIALRLLRALTAPATTQQYCLTAIIE